MNREPETHANPTGAAMSSLSTAELPFAKPTSEARTSETRWPKLSPMETGIRGRCPRCGQGKLFNGFLTLAPRCEVCGLDYSFADPADGPAFFVICFGCIPAVVFGLWIEVAFEAPYWVHLFTTLPFLLLTCIPPLRPLKGWLVSSQYFYKAEEGRLIYLDRPAAQTKPS